MPYKSEKIKIAGTKYDRRVKLTELQKSEIRENVGGLSQRKLAALYGVSRRLIVFVQYPERLKENVLNRQKNGGSKQYYVKEKHTLAIREHRKYKQALYVDNIIQL